MVGGVRRFMVELGLYIAGVGRKAWDEASLGTQAGDSLEAWGGDGLGAGNLSHYLALSPTMVPFYISLSPRAPVLHPSLIYQD